MTPPRLTVYVAYHARGPRPVDTAPYVAVCNVSADGTRPPGFEVYDDDGGVPEKNLAYCELSPTHRLQQRADTEWVGLVHYRRIFATHTSWRRRGPDPGLYRIPRFDWEQPDRWGADESSLLAAVTGTDWCTAPPLDMRRRGFGSLLEHFVRWHPAAWLDPLTEAVTEVVPAAPSFEDYLRSTTTLRPFNMFLGRRDCLLSYGAFLWPVLDGFEAKVGDLPTEGYQARWAGFLAERLHGYWLDHVASPDLRVGQLPVALLGSVGSPGGTTVVTPRSVRGALKGQAQALQSILPRSAAGLVRRRTGPPAAAAD